MGHATCSIESCGDPVVARGWCSKHYQRWKRQGDPQYTRRGDYDARFMAFVTCLGNGCWRWDGSKGLSGYGEFRPGYRVGAHRWAYERWIGSIPDGLHLDHFRHPQDGCIGPSCVNPTHIRPVTPRENILRSSAPPSANLAKTHCNEGHPLEGDNLSITSEGNRYCRKCRNAWAWRKRRELNPDTKPARALRTHCPVGHPYDESNTRWYQGRRCCKECLRVAKRAAYRRKMGKSD